MGTGHLGPQCADYLEVALKESVLGCVRGLPTPLSRETAATLEEVLKKNIQNLDARLLSDVLDLLPRTASPEDVEQIYRQAPNRTKLERAWSGAVFQAVVLDPARENLWIIGVGDCDAVLAVPDEYHLGWKSLFQAEHHDASNMKERQRICDVYGESVLKDGRILSVLEPTRAMGDAWSKLPKNATELLYRHYKTPRIDYESKMQKAANHASQLDTPPPYVDATPAIKHFRIEDLQSQEWALILATDGLRGCFDGDMGRGSVLDALLRDLRLRRRSTKLPRRGRECEAVELLFHALGGQDKGPQIRRLWDKRFPFSIDDVSLCVLVNMPRA